MPFSSIPTSGLTQAEVLSAITTDSTKYAGGNINDVIGQITTDDTKFAGANIANLDYAISTLLSDIQTLLTETIYLSDQYTWDATADGSLEFPVLTAGVDNIPQVGTWYLKYQFTTNGNDNDQMFWWLFFEDANNYYQLRLYDSAEANGIKLKKNEASSATDIIAKGTTNNDTDEHYIEVIRGCFGDFELKEDGVSIGTAEDDFMPTVTGTKTSFGDSSGGSVLVIKELKHVRFL